MVIISLIISLLLVIAVVISVILIINVDYNSNVNEYIIEIEYSNLEEETSTFNIIGTLGEKQFDSNDNILLKDLVSFVNSPTGQKFLSDCILAHIEHRRTNGYWHEQAIKDYDWVFTNEFKSIIIQEAHNLDYYEQYVANQTEGESIVVDVTPIYNPELNQLLIQDYELIDNTCLEVTYILDYPDNPTTVYFIIDKDYNKVKDISFTKE